MIGTLSGPWLLLVALFALGFVVRRAPRPPRGEVWLTAVLVAGAAAARFAFGFWGPLHINGQGPLWIRGALDPEALSGYGPGYFELFGWVALLSAPPDSAICNAFHDARRRSRRFGVRELAPALGWAGFAHQFPLLHPEGWHSSAQGNALRNAQLRARLPELSGKAGWAGCGGKFDIQAKRFVAG